MESHKPVGAMVDAPKRHPVLLLLAFVTLAIVVAGAFYLGLQKTAILEEQKRLDVDVASLKDEIRSLKSQNIEAAQLAQEWLASVEKDEIQWSQVITRIESLLPVDNLTLKPTIKILSYSGSAGGKLSLNAQTYEAPIEPFGDVSQLLSVFNGSSFFSNAYVPSVTRGETNSGNKVLSFVMNLNYDESKAARMASSQAGTVPTSTDASSTQQTTGTPKISR